MFRTKYVPLVERKRLFHEYLSLNQKTKSVTEITKIFTERALLCPEYGASEEFQMSYYLSIPKMEICEFVSTQRYGSLSELQSFTRKREIQIETQTREKR